MANGQFVADVPGAIQRGLQFRQAAQLRPIQQRAAELGVQRQELGLQQQQQGLQFGGLQQQRAQQQIGAEADENKRVAIINAALNIENLRDEEIAPFLQSEIQNAIASGRESPELSKVLELAQTGDFNKLREGAKNVVNIGVRQGIIKAPSQRPDEQFTLSPGQQRFGAAGELIAEVAPRAAARVAATEQAIIPQVLLTGLDPGLAEQGAAAFTAAGGGKDGLTAFQKIVDKGTEQQRRLASPQILKSSFPKASEAETVQLQAAMDAAKTTETGLKAAQTVRSEQRRLVKAKGFQERVVSLLTGILASGEGLLGGDLGDVLGSIEGAIDVRFFSDDEAQVISDIEEAVNILTADNLDLMSGVLSETDIKIIANLAGGALNRKRTKSRFVKDVTTLRDKLASQLVVTVDDTAAARGSVSQQATPELPPSGRQGGELKVDAQGNRAFVFPDGTFEEVP